MVLSLEYSEATVELPPVLISMLLCLRGCGDPTRDGGPAGWESGQNTDLSINFTVLFRCGSWHPKTSTTVASEITDHHNTQ